MKNGSYADQIVAAKLMLAGLKAHEGRLAQWGFDAEYVTGMEQLFAEAQQAHNEQQALIARLKEKTARVNQLFNALEKKRTIAKHTVKCQMEQESWTEFGIADNR